MISVYLYSTFYQLGTIWPQVTPFAVPPARAFVYLPGNTGHDQTAVPIDFKFAGLEEPFGPKAGVQYQE